MLDQYIIEISKFSKTAIITTFDEREDYSKKFVDNCKYNFKLAEKTLWGYSDGFSTYLLVDDDELEEVLSLLKLYNYCKDFKK